MGDLRDDELMKALMGAALMLILFGVLLACSTLVTP